MLLSAMLADASGMMQVNCAALFGPTGRGKLPYISARHERPADTGFMHHSRQASALTIEQQHAAILACCDDLLDALGSDNSIGEVGQVRMRLAGLLHANLAAEEAQLIGPIRRLPTNRRPRLFAELNAEAASLRARYSEHVGRWTLAAIVENRPAYERAAAELVRQVKAHLNDKRAVLPEWYRVLS